MAARLRRGAGLPGTRPSVGAVCDGYFIDFFSGPPSPDDLSCMIEQIGFACGSRIRSVRVDVRAWGSGCDLARSSFAREWSCALSAGEVFGVFARPPFDTWAPERHTLNGPRAVRGRHDSHVMGLPRLSKRGQRQVDRANCCLCSIYTLFEKCLHKNTGFMCMHLRDRGRRPYPALWSMPRARKLSACGGYSANMSVRRASDKSLSLLHCAGSFHEVRSLERDEPFLSNDATLPPGLRGTLNDQFGWHRGFPYELRERVARAFVLRFLGERAKALDGVPDAALAFTVGYASLGAPVCRESPSFLSLQKAPLSPS